MSVDVFETQLLVRYVSCLMFAFFLVQAVEGGVQFFSNKVKFAKWQMGMCLSTVLYVTVLFLHTHEGFGRENDIVLIKLGWTGGILGFLFYLILVERFLPRKLKTITFAKYSMVFCATVYFISFIGFDFNLNDGLRL